MPSIKRSCWWLTWLASLLTWATLPGPLPAAIVQTGNVSPNVSTWTSTTAGHIGRASHGSVTVDAGSLLVSRYGFVGSQNGGIGVATVAGSNSAWTNSDDLYVGAGYGNGTLAIESGGTVSSRYGYLGDSAGSTGTAMVTGAGSTWTSSAGLRVGEYGSGALTIAAGGKVSNVWGDIGYRYGSTGAVTVTGADSTWTNSAELYVGRSGAGSLTIEAGATVSNATQGYIGFFLNSEGTAAVSGTGSKWITGHSLYVGGMGAGALTVSERGEVVAKTLHASLSSLKGNGTITATGAVLDADLAFNATHGTSQSFAFGSGGMLNLSMSGGGLGVGYQQSGALSISEGVDISSEFGSLGSLPGSTGTATVIGAGSKWNSGVNLRVGDLGNGMLTIAAGGAAKNTMGLVGHSPGSTGTVTVTGAGSQWINSGSLSVGNSGNGMIAIEAAGRVNSSEGNLGVTSGSTGTVTVTSIGSMWTMSSSLTIGRSGNGSIVIEAGGLVNNSSGYLGHSSGSIGTATVTGSGSKWINRTGLYIGRSGNGTLAITAGGQVSSAGGYLGDNAGSSGSVTVAGPGSEWAITFALYVGETGYGELTIEDGGLVSVGRTLTIDNRSPTSQSSINMNTGGMLALYGNAADSLSQFLELVQGTDAIRFWDNALAAWAPIASATAGEDYTLEYLATGDLAGYTLLTVGQATSPGLAGDFNADGSVDGADFLTWQRGGSPAPHSEGDLNAWKTSFAALASGAASDVSAATSVPEPTTAALALVLPLAASHCRAARKRRLPITA